MTPVHTPIGAPRQSVHSPQESQLPASNPGMVRHFADGKAENVDRPGFALDPVNDDGDLLSAREVGGMCRAPEFCGESLEDGLAPGDERHRRK
jgi:hypothetical protein